MLLASSPSRLTNLKVDSYTGAVASLSWTPSAEQGVASYIVALRTGGGSAAPPGHRHATARDAAADRRRARVVSVKAVNARGLEGWDWAKTIVGEPHGTRITQ